MSSKFANFALGQLPWPIALSAEIFRAYLRAGHMHAIVQWVHLGPAKVDSMDEFMYHGLVSMCLIAQMLLTKKNLWQKSQTNLAIIGSVELLPQILVCAMALRRLGSLCNGIRQSGCDCCAVGIGIARTGLGIDDGFLDDSKASTCHLVATVHTFDESLGWVAAHLHQPIDEELNRHVALESTLDVAIAFLAGGLHLLCSFLCCFCGSSVSHCRWR